MEVLIALIVILLVLVVAFGLVRARRRKGHVVAAGPAPKEEATQ